MRLPIRHALILAAGLVVAACSAAPGPSPSPAPTDPPDALRLRLTITQAIPPEQRFGWFAQVAITNDGILVVPGAVPAIYPGPLVTPLWGRAVSDAGWAAIVALARELGLLVDGAQFVDGAPAPGAMLGRIEILVDGRVLTINGDPEAQIMCITTPCDPPPGTAAAFGEFWRRASDLATWMPGQLGPEREYLPAGYAILVGPPGVPEAGIQPQVMEWPLEADLATFGIPVPGGALRCGEVTGDDAATLGPALRAANQLTQWAQDPTAAARYGFVVRPLLPGETVCAELFGAG